MFYYLALVFLAAFLVLALGMVLWVAPSFASQVAAALFSWIPHDKVNPADVRDLGSQIVGGGAVGAYIAFLALFVELQINARDREYQAAVRHREEILQEHEARQQARLAAARACNDFMLAVDPWKPVVEDVVADETSAPAHHAGRDPQEVRKKFFEVQLHTGREVRDAALELMALAMTPLAPTVDREEGERRLYERRKRLDEAERRFFIAAQNELGLSPDDLYSERNTKR